MNLRQPLHETNVYGTQLPWGGILQLKILFYFEKKISQKCKKLNIIQYLMNRKIIMSCICSYTTPLVEFKAHINCQIL